MNGLKFLGLDLAVLFALYGMKQTNLTKDEVKAVDKVASRLGMKGQSKDEKKATIAAWRAGRLKQLQGSDRYKDTDPEFSAAYGKKAWLR